MMRSTFRRLTRGRWPAVRPDEQLSCREVGRLLQRFLDGELEDDVAVRAIVAHLDHCPPCELERDVYERISTSLAAGARPVDPDSLARLEAFGRRLADG